MSHMRAQIDISPDLLVSRFGPALYRAEIRASDPVVHRRSRIRIRQAPTPSAGHNLESQYLKTWVEIVGG